MSRFYSFIQRLYVSFVQFHCLQFILVTFHFKYALLTFILFHSTVN